MSFKSDLAYEVAYPLEPCECGGRAEFFKPFGDGRAGICVQCALCGDTTPAFRSYAGAAASWNAIKRKTS